MRSFVVKGIFALILIWFLLFGLLSVLPQYGDSHFAITQQTDTNHIIQRIEAALAEIQTLKKNNDDMKKIIISSNHQNSYLNGEPSDAYESTRRLMELDLKELWYNIRSKNEAIPESDMEQMHDIYRNLRSHIIKMRTEDGYEASRMKENEELSRIIQNRIHTLQNPQNCEKAKKLTCTLNKGCGFGCQIHHALYCLMMAYANGRTLILESRGWRYNRKGWENVFLPISETCRDGSGDRADWSTGKFNTQVLQLPIVDFLKPRPPYLPIAIPSDLAARLEKSHGEPHIWWVGQFMKYLLRLQPQTQEMIDDYKVKLGFTTPIVGIHVRRTDKIGTEASFHTLKEYMVHAEEYYSILDKATGKESNERRVFIASDDPNVISEAAKSYTSSDKWTILGDSQVAKSAGVSERYNGLYGIIKDVFLLAECDLVVCTFSSQVCRLAYEIMQTKYPDASQRFVSLDDVYYYGGGNGLIQQAHQAHISRNPNEIELKVGDKIGIAGNHWNGMSKGTNLRTNKIGLYPSYKAHNDIQHIEFPKNKWWLKGNSKET